LVKDEEAVTDIMELFKKIQSAPAAPARVTHLVVGLGNPGKEYVNTRHNIGFTVLDALAGASGATVDRLRFRALTGEGTVGGVRALLMKPQTYMNASGLAVREAADFYKIPPENILVISDDVSFDVGKMRIRRSGSHGGHNGLRSIVDQLGSDAFMRLRIGVGKKPSPETDLADWVLGGFSASDRELLAARCGDYTDAISLILSGRIEDAMTRYSNK
jgi:PTH1 family peptidyl-tRNA hydrolase